VDQEDTMRAFIAMSAVLGLLLVAASARADEAKTTNVAVDDLPDAVVDAAKAKFPKGNITTATQREENGQKLYELKVKTGDKEETLKLTPEGKTIQTAEKPREVTSDQSQPTGRRRGILRRWRARRMARRGY
jgi:hypothetical protein